MYQFGDSVSKLGCDNNAFVLENLTSHLDGELPSKQNQLACLSNSDQP